MVKDKMCLGMSFWVFRCFEWYNVSLSDCEWFCNCLSNGSFDLWVSENYIGIFKLSERIVWIVEVI